MALGLELLNGLWALVLLLLSIPCAVFVLQLLAALTSHRSGFEADASVRLLGGDGVASAAQQAGPVVVLIPAHNEAGTLDGTLQALSDAQAHGLTLCVVADNCTDATAQVARDAGAWVLERHNLSLRGKGHALQHGMDAMRALNPAAVVVLDADCRTQAAQLAALAAEACALNRPVQGINLMHAPPGAGVGLKVAEFTWLIKTAVRPMGWQRLGLSCPLMGTGFAMPGALAMSLPWASSHTVEDMEMTLTLARQGLTPRWSPISRVDSWFPLQAQAQAAQRQRWEHGHLDVVLQLVPKALWESVRRGPASLTAVALDQSVPPLSLLVLLLLANVALALVWGAWAHHWLPLAWAGSLLASVGLVVLAAWWRWGQQLLSARELWALPWFVLKKLGIYRRFFSGQRHRQWNRAERDEPPRRE